MINSNYDIETCSWCNGEGIDQSFKGNPYHQPNCGRCNGSGKVYVTDELSTTKRRRKYMGPVPKPEIVKITPEIMAAAHTGETQVLAMPEAGSLVEPTPDGIKIYPPKRKPGRPKKIENGSNPT